MCIVCMYSILYIHCTVYFRHSSKGAKLHLTDFQSGRHLQHIERQKFTPTFQMENHSEAKTVSLLPTFWRRKSSKNFTLMRDQRVWTWTSAMMTLKWKNPQWGESVIKILLLMTNLTNAKFKDSRLHSDENVLSRVDPTRSCCL